MSSTPLNELLSHVPASLYAAGYPPQSPGNPEIQGICLDSRRVQPGMLFVALSGGSFDGHDFIQAALERGAAAVVGTRASSSLPGALEAWSYIQVLDARLALAYFAAAFYGYPGGEMTMIGVTGTDGKTTTANLIHAALHSAGIPSGMITTVNALIGAQVLDTGFHVTTPEAPDVQRYLHLMVEAGLQSVVLETTSHGWAQHRVAACGFDLSVVTNITHEHLDYHGSYEAYRDAKARLFRSLGDDRWKERRFPPVAVLNRDDDSFDYLFQVVEAVRMGNGGRVRKLTYGFDAHADVRGSGLVHNPEGLRLFVEGPGFAGWLSSPLSGIYNASNILAAVATTVAGMELDFGAVRHGVASMNAIPGRMERIDLGTEFTTIVDFAHTPNALRNVLQAARKLADHSTPPGRVIAIFGSAGQRDRQKRRLMAQVAAELADFSVLTAEDPRSESLAEILEEMASGATSHSGVEGDTFVRIPDRRDAIRFGINLARPGDVVLALGKGHEQSMCFGETEYPWDDRVAMRAALSEYLGTDGPQMPYLPDPL